MDPRLPQPLQPMLDRYLSRLHGELPGLLAGFYVYGSVAEDAWSPGASDVDGLALLARPCTPQDLAALRALHRDIAAEWPGQPFDVSYVQWADRGLTGDAAPPHPFHHDGVLHASDAGDPNSPLRAAFGWWQLQRHGMTLAGPAVAELGLAVTEADLVAGCRRLLDEHWLGWRRSPRLVASLRHAKSVDWAVLGILRTWYTLRERDVATKPAAVKYGIAHLPPRWHPLIRETLAARRQPVRRGLFFRLRTWVDAALFMRVMVKECRRLCAAPAPPGLRLYSRSRPP